MFDITGILGVFCGLAFVLLLFVMCWRYCAQNSLDTDILLDHTSGQDYRRLVVAQEVQPGLLLVTQGEQCKAYRIVEECQQQLPSGAVLPNSQPRQKKVLGPSKSQDGDDARCWPAVPVSSPAYKTTVVPAQQPTAPPLPPPYTSYDQTW